MVLTTHLNKTGMEIKSGLATLIQKPAGLLPNSALEISIVNPALCMVQFVFAICSVLRLPTAFQFVSLISND